MISGKSILNDNPSENIDRMVKFKDNPDIKTLNRWVIDCCLTSDEQSCSYMATSQKIVAIYCHITATYKSQLTVLSRKYIYSASNGVYLF